MAAIGAKTPTSPWNGCSNIGYDVTWPSNIPDYEAAFAAQLDVLIYSGDVDVATCPFPTTQVAVDTLSKLPGGAITSNWTSWVVDGLDGIAANQTGGYIERHTAFTFATVKGAGHEAPGFQPLASFQLIKAFVTNTLDKLRTAEPRQAIAAPAAKLTQGSILRKHVAATMAKSRRA
jgi:hypothetical protein